jgi:bleomycin hydrolase
MHGLKYLVVFAFLFSLYANGQTDSDFKIIKQNKSTSVKNQQRTGTCWCFSTISFLESELLRMGKGEFDFSEMYIIRNVYPEKARYFVQLHGKANFSEGGQAHDVINAMKKIGIVPQNEYAGNLYNPGKHNHSEMVTSMEGLLKGLVADRKELSVVWINGINALLDVYMGENIKNFSYDGTVYAPRSFVTDNLSLNAGDYVELTSYSHHPYYSMFSLEVPDNWSHDLYYNLPIDDLIETMEKVIIKGYTIVWDGDVSEKGFKHKKGVAELVDDEIPSQENRQLMFNSWKSTDDHLMHITGIAENSDGKKYFITKNSWAEDSNHLGGYIYMSEDYVRLHTVAVLVNRNSIPKKTAQKLFK